MLQTHRKAWYWGKVLRSIQLKRIMPRTKDISGTVKHHVWGENESLFTQCSIDWLAAEIEVCRSTVASKKVTANWDIAAIHRTQISGHTAREAQRWVLDSLVEINGLEDRYLMLRTSEDALPRGKRGI